nr:hypothetical protein [Tanacetum cinerariifolium]
DDDSLHEENIEYVEASPHDSELVSLEAAEIVIPEVEEIEDNNLREKFERVLSIRRTRLTPASLEMCMCLKDHLDAKEHKQDKCPLETPLDFGKDVFDDEVQRNEAISLSDEEITLDGNGSSEGTMSPGGPRFANA